VVSVARFDLIRVASKSWRYLPRTYLTLSMSYSSAHYRRSAQLLMTSGLSHSKQFSDYGEVQFGRLLLKLLQEPADVPFLHKILFLL
jgi:hypothetical protein